MENQFIILIQENEGIINKVISLHCRNASDNRDFYQEIILQAWKSYSNFKGHSKFSTWLYKVSLNTLLSLKSKKKIPLIGYGKIEFPDQPIYENTKLENADRLKIILDSLNDLDRSIITLHLDGYKIKEISEIIGYSEANTKVKIHRIKKKLISKFKPVKYGI